MNDAIIGDCDAMFTGSGIDGSEPRKTPDVNILSDVDRWMTLDPSREVDARIRSQRSHPGFVEQAEEEIDHALRQATQK